MGKIDIGCDDFGNAARNREMVAKKNNIIGYVMVEAALKGWPLREAIPNWIPTGNLTKVGKTEMKNLYGMHVINESNKQ